MNYIENTRYGYKNAEGHRIHVSTVGAGSDHVELAIAGVGDLGWRSLNIPAAEAPGIALALLKAAGVQPHHGTARCAGDRMDMWAVRYLADHVEAQAEDAAEKELTRRRDELARKLTGFPAYNYQSASNTIQRAIDIIIQLQDEATQ